MRGGWEQAEPAITSLHGSLFSPHDGLCFPDFHYVDVKHIVARKEADESGMSVRPAAERAAFAIDLLNFTLPPSSLNASRGRKDAGDLASAERSSLRDVPTSEGKCFWPRRQFA